MRVSLKKVMALLLCCCALLPAATRADEDSDNFTLRNGDRNSKKIAITVDDCYKNKREYILEDVELCKQYGVHMTFFPVDYTGCLTEEYREIWRAVVDSGCEIGTHTYSHVYIGSRDNPGILKALGRWQEDLDKTLGYHYATRWLRPPYGSIDDKKGGKGNSRVVKMIRQYGFEHIVCWDVSETDPDKAIKKIQNGSILLFHAKKKDTNCIAKLIPELLEAGYEIVTLSELFGYDPPETSDELYVYDPKAFGGS